MCCRISSKKNILFVNVKYKSLLFYKTSIQFFKSFFITLKSKILYISSDDCGDENIYSMFGFTKIYVLLNT